MSPDDPRHGKHAGAIAHWRAGEKPCDPCALAARRQNKAAHIDKARGRPRTVPLGDRAVRIITTTPLSQLAHATGIRVDRLIRYRKAGACMNVHRTTRDRILIAGSGAFWTPVGIQRRLKALNALGWSMNKIAATAGADVDGFKRLRNRAAPQFVRGEVADKVIAVYEELCMVSVSPGRASTRARNEARRNGWPPPLAWSDIDDPDEIPEDWHYKARDLLVVRKDVMTEVVEAGGNISEACRALNTTRKNLQKWCERHDMSELYLTLTAREGRNGNQYAEGVA